MTIRALLTNSEKKILAELVHGKPDKEIAKILGMGMGTVKVHMKAAYRKLQVDNRTQAAIWAYSHPEELRTEESK